jgi:allantoin racemase
MKILIINPNSDPAMTKAVGRTAAAFAGGAYETECRSTPGAPKFIETYEDAAQAAPGMLALVRENKSGCDAFVVACHCDPNLDLLKEATTKPVVGIGEASMKIASILGHRFSVLSSARHSIPNKEALIRSYHLEGLLASVRAVERGDYVKAGRAAIDKDGAEVIVLGCAGMTGLDKKLQARLGAPVLDGVICGLILAHGLARYGVGTSKVRRYAPV